MWSLVRSVGCATLLSFLIVAPLAAAQSSSCALLAPGEPAGGALAPAPAPAEALEAVRQALEAAEVRIRAAETAPTCNTMECGATVAAELDVDFVVLVTVWSTRRRATQVVVTLIGEGISAAGDAAVEASVPEAAVEALGIALQRWETAQMGYVAVESDPPGARVFVDDRPVGTAPVRHLVHGGTRQVRLMLDGYEPATRTVEVPPSGEATVEITLIAPTTEAPPAAVVVPASSAEPHFANWIVGGALLLGGVLAAVYPVDTLTRDAFDPLAGVLLGTSILALAGGAAVLITQPFRLIVSPSALGAEFTARF